MAVKADLVIMHGEEPTWKSTLTESDHLEIHNAFGWYHVSNFKGVAKKKWVLEYLKSNPDLFTNELILKIDRVPDNFFNTIGPCARMISRGAKFPIKEFHAFVELISETADEYGYEEKPAHCQKPTIQDRMKIQFTTIMSTIESEFDNFIEEDFTSKFDVGEYFGKMQLSPVHAKKIHAHYDDLQVQLINSEIDPDLEEAYSCYTEKQKNKLINFLEEIISFCDKVVVKGKSARKPRTKKIKSPEKQTEKVKYLAHDKSLKLNSLKPTKIVYSKQVWLWNSKYKRVIILNSTKGFQVKGTTILGLTNDCFQMTLRKPKEFFKELGPSMTKPKMFKMLSNLTTRKQKTTGRLSADTLIMRAI